MGEVIVSMSSISKTFPGVKALDNVSFELCSGEVMALLGENGAGKSTLMKILSGVYTRDGGEMKIFGKEYGDLTPKQAQQIGVAIIHQELNMCRHLSVTENMFLGREKQGGLALDNRAMEKEAKRILDDLKIDIDPRQTVGDLPVSKQQMVEIAKALSTNAKILIMDEPTSSLTSKEIDDLFRIIRKLKAEGCGIVYISHRLEELAHIVDRVTIMRDGQFITKGNFRDMTMDQIITNMVGREIKEQFPRVECKKGKKIFDLTRDDMLEYIDYLKSEGKSNPTISRSIASVKRLYKYLLSKNLVEENIVIVEGRLSIREDDTTTIIANEIKNFGEQKQKVLILDINDSTEEQKSKLRGAIKYFCGDKNNINVQIKIDKEIKPCGQIYLTKDIMKVIQNILGDNRVKLEEK